MKLKQQIKQYAMKIAAYLLCRCHFDEKIAISRHRTKVGLFLDNFSLYFEAKKKFVLGLNLMVDRVG